MAFVFDQHQKPLMPCSEKCARLRPERGPVAIHKMAPFTIRLIGRTTEESVLETLRVKCDPDSKTAGVAIIMDGAKGSKVIFFGVIVPKAHVKRRTLRQRRRYRKPRFQNRQRQAGWFPPPLGARVDQTLHALAKRRKCAPIRRVSVESVRLAMQKLEHAEISGVEYPPGILLGREIREYLLEKRGRACVYCGTIDVPLQEEHTILKSRGRTNRVSKLVLACEPCNLWKNALAAEEFGYPEIQAQAQNPLKGAAMMNATRWRLYGRFKATRLPVEGRSGRRTKKQRLSTIFPKSITLMPSVWARALPNTLPIFRPMCRFGWIQAGASGGLFGW